MNFKVQEIDLLEFADGVHEYKYKVMGRVDMQKRMPLSVTAIVKAVYPFDKDTRADEIVNAYLLHETLPYDKDLATIFSNTKFEFDTPTDVKQRVLKEKVITKWSSAADYGTSVHAYLETYIAKGIIPEKGVLSEKEQKSFDAGMRFLDEERKDGFEPLANGVEIKICAPFAKTKYHTQSHDKRKPIHLQECCGIAGGIDLILYNKKTKKCKICDWKTTKRSFGEYLEKHKCEWRLQMGLYHYMLSQALTESSYDLESLAIFQIHPDHSEKHVFGVKECEMEVNTALGDTVFWVRGVSTKEKVTRSFSMMHTECCGLAGGDGPAEDE